MAMLSKVLAPPMAVRDLTIQAHTNLSAFPINDATPSMICAFFRGLLEGLEKLKIELYFRWSLRIQVRNHVFYREKIDEAEVATVCDLVRMEMMQIAGTKVEGDDWEGTHWFTDTSLLDPEL
jgi:hypothetical protein